MKTEFNFTTNKLKKLENTTEKPIDFKDATVAGLRLRLSPANKKTYRLRAWDRHKGKTVQMVIGTFPDMTIGSARDKAQELLNDISLGVDVQAERKSIKKEQTFEELFYHWLNTWATQNRTFKEYEPRYKNYIQSYLGDKRISEITEEAIQLWRNKVLKQKKTRGKGTISPTTINRAFAIISAVYNQCMPNLPNPCKTIKKFKEHGRDVFFYALELDRLLAASEDVYTSVDIRDLVQLALFTGARRANILSMEWTELQFDLRRWIIPGVKFKNGKATPVVLLDEAIQILKRRKEQSTSRYVFASDGKTGHITEPKKGWKALLERADLNSGFWLHDLRRTLGSHQAIGGTSLKIIGAALGHKSQAATNRYAHLQDAPIRESMERAVADMKSK